MPFAPGTKLGRYEIRSKIGKGGMGEVYLAQDTRLDRKVALKTLPETLFADKQANNRFIQEAKAASALSNPHIVTVYDIVPEGSQELIVMEYVDGQTLRRLISQGNLELKKIVDYAAQVANGLAAAHQAGIVHRDIKPENLIVATTGTVKILDFGLAKLTEEQPTFVNSQLSTAPHVQFAPQVETVPGAVVGTLGYMSPEQALGQKIDHRTDIFSLGVVLYEGFTGQRPFQGESAIDTLHAVINLEPTSVVELNPRLPGEVSDLLSKALAKDRTERYQHVGDLELDLRRLKRKLETRTFVSEREPERITRQGSTKGMIRWFVTVMLFILGLSVAAWTGRRFAQPGTSGWTTAHTVATQLTNYGGTETSGALSPDGKSFVFVSQHGVTPDIWLRQIAGGEPVRLTNDPADERDLSYAPDGETIYFTRIDPTGSSIWRIGLLGGQARLIVKNGRKPAPSNDGKNLAYFVSRGFGQGDTLVVQALDGSATRTLADGVLGGVLASSIAWSPDDHRLSYVQRGLFAPSNLFTIEVATGEVRQVTRFTRSGEGIEEQVWLPDNRHLVVSYIPQSTFFQTDLGVLDTQDGSISRLTFNVAQSFSSLSLSADGRRLIANAQQTRREVWKVPLGADALANGAAAQQVLDSTLDPMWISVSRDGRTLLFNNATTGTRNLWTMPIDKSTSPRQITAIEGDNVMHSSFSPDNSHVAFVSRATGNSDVWIQNTDGSDLRQLTNDEAADAWPVWSPDGQWIVFGSLRNNHWEINRVQAQGGQSEKIIDGFFRGDCIRQPNGSGSWLVTWADPGIRLVDVEQRKVLWEQQLDRGSGFTLPMFSPDGRFISLPRYETSDRDAIWLYDTATGESKVGVRFSRPFRILFRASWVDDGKALIVNRGQTISHIVLFDRFWIKDGT